MSGAWTNLVYCPNGLEFNAGFNTPLVGETDQLYRSTHMGTKALLQGGSQFETSRGEIGSKLT